MYGKNYGSECDFVWMTKPDLNPSFKQEHFKESIRRELLIVENKKKRENSSNWIVIYFWWFQNHRAKFRTHERLTHPFERDPTSASISEGLLIQPSLPMVIGGVAKDSNELYGHQHHHHQQNGSESSYTLYPEPLLPTTSNTTAVSTLSNGKHGH